MRIYSCCKLIDGMRRVDRFLKSGDTLARTCSAAARVLGLPASVSKVDTPPLDFTCVLDEWI